MKDTLPRMVVPQCECVSGRTVIRRKQAGRYRDISWNQLAGQIGGS